MPGTGTCPERAALRATARSAGSENGNATFVRNAVIALVVAAAVSPLSRADTPPPRISWADDRHRFGWVEVGSPSDPPPAEPRCRGARRGTTEGYICATENGGRTWRRIFKAGEGLIYIADFTRTSLTSGIVAIGRESLPRRTLRNGVFWTRDNGRHWYETTRIGASTEGRGRLLFWISRSRHVLYQVQPWPPRVRVRCRGFFVRHAVAQRPQRGGNICVGSRHDAGMSSTRVAELPAGFAVFSALASIPNGVAALVTGDARTPRILIRQGRAGELRTLPPAPRAGEHGDYELEVSWPRILVSARQHADFKAFRTVWTSDDGGFTWTVRTDEEA